MMRTLILLRHGESAEIEPGQSDFDRTLTARGEASIRHLATTLSSLKIFPDKILCSPALRTKQTATLLLSELKLSLTPSFEHTIYNGGVEDYLDLLQQNSFASCLLLVGHNPTISGLMNMLGIRHFVGFAPGQAAVVAVGDELKKSALVHSIPAIH